MNMILVKMTCSVIDACGTETGDIMHVCSKNWNKRTFIEISWEIILEVSAKSQDYIQNSIH